MSEYQYYEFQAIDRPLDDRQMSELRSVSTRATITSTSFINEYHWGDFRGSPHQLMEKYFDAFLYLANWGTRQIMLRLPAHLVDLKTAQRYCVGDAASAWVNDDSLIISFLSEDEDGDDDEWVGGEGWLASIATVRTDLASGDLRALYLAWLLCVQSGGVDESAGEPPVPADLRHVTAGLRGLTDFLRIDDDLITAAAAVTDEPVEDLGVDLVQWVGALPAGEKDGFIVRLARGDAYVQAELLRRFRGRRTRTAGTRRRRTVGELIDAAKDHRMERERLAAERRAHERARREKQATIAREKRLDALARDEDAAWRRVASLIDAKKPRDYDTAVALLLDLRALGERVGGVQDFEQEMRRLRAQHARKPSFLTRLGQAGL